MAKKSFSLGGKAGASELLEEKESILSESEFNLKLIKADNIVPNELNKDFSQSDIDELSRSIEDIGLQHNLVVLKQADGKYRLISGERRFRAICALIERRASHSFKNGIPCKVVSNLTEVDEEIRLLRANTDTRELTASERRNAVLRLIDLYKIKKDKGEIKSIYAELANDLQMTVRQVQKYAATGNLIPALEKLLKNGAISLSDGERFSVLDEEGQQTIANLYEKQGFVSKEELNEVKRLKEEKELLNKELGLKISDLVKEKEQLMFQIEEQEKQALNISRAMESPEMELEQFFLKKAEAERAVGELKKQKAQIQEKYDELKEKLKKPVVVDSKKMEELKVSLKVDAALSRMEEEFATIKAKSSIFSADQELLNRYQILCNRILSLRDSIKRNPDGNQGTAVAEKVSVL